MLEKEQEKLGNTDPEDTPATGSRSRLIEDKDKSASQKDQEPYEIPAEDEAIDKEEQKFDEIREAEMQEKLEEQK